MNAEVLDRLYRDWKTFFLAEDRFDYLADPKNADGTQQGYHPTEVSETAVGHTTKDLKEFFHVVPGGRIPPALEEDILTYRESTFALGEEIVDWIRQNAPPEVQRNIDAVLPNILCKTASLLRVLHYPPLQGDESADAVRAAAHEDINLVTVLPVAEQPGLQVRDTSGTWIDVASIRGELVINSGDMLRELTDGYFPSTTHRVMNPGGDIANESRISIPFFLTPRSDTVLSQRYTAGSYLEERLQLITRPT